MPDDKHLPYFSAEYRFNDRHQIYLDWRGLERNGIQEHVHHPFQIKLDGNLYHVDASASLSTELDLDIMRLGYGYQFFASEHLNMHFLVGVHITRLGLGFEGDIDIIAEDASSDTSVEGQIYESVTAPLPNMGLLIEHHLSEKLMLKSHLHAFYLKFDELTGWMYEVEFGAKYNVTDNFSVTATYNYYEIGVDSQTEYTELDVTYQFYGPMLKVAYQF
nr:DUF481 domain-containing protein [Shewanella olleyana]